MISAFELHKECSDIDVELQIRQAFQGKLPDDADIEIVHSVHTTPSQLLTVPVIKQVFCNNKPVYIRPNRQILHQLVKREKC